MVDLKLINEEDILKYAEVYHFVYELFDNCDGNYYLLDVNGEERLLYKLGNTFGLFKLDQNGEIKYNIFSINDNYEIIEGEFDDFDFSLEDNVKVIYNRESEISESLVLRKREDGLDNEGYNGLLVYTQYDPHNDTGAIITYQKMIQEGKNIISSFYLKDPYMFFLEQGVTKKHSKLVKYIKEEFNLEDDPYIFNLMQIKDQGLLGYLKNNIEYSQKKVSRYYKVLITYPDNTVVTGSPFTKQYTLEDMFELIRDNGFKTQIPEILFLLINDEYEELNIFKEIVALIKSLEQNRCEEEVLKLDLTKKDSSD